MNPKNPIAYTVAALSLAVSVMAGPPSSFFATPRSAAKAAESVPPTQAAAEPVVASAPKVYQVMRGSPKNPFSGMTYVEASGHELSKSRVLAMEKVSESSVRALAKADEVSQVKTGD